MLDVYYYNIDNAVGIPKPFCPYFTNSFTDNCHTFLLLIIFGVFAFFFILIFDLIKNRGKKTIEFGKIKIIKKSNDKKNGREHHKTDENSNNEGELIQDQNNKNLESENLFNKNGLLSEVVDSKYKKCTIEANKQYFKYNYFIRVYQITMIRVIFTCFIVINNTGLKSSVVIEVVLSYFVLFFWIFGCPIFIFIYLRKRHKALMSPGVIIQFGAVYLNYRGINKDVFALFMQFKFMILPMISIFFWKFPKIQMILMILLYFINIIFVTKYTPFCKVSKVFTEAVSASILMALCIIILILESNPSWKNENAFRVIVLAMMGALYLIKSIKVVFDSIIRLRDFFKMRQPVLVGVDEPYLPQLLDNINDNIEDNELNDANEKEVVEEDDKSKVSKEKNNYTSNSKNAKDKKSIEMVNIQNKVEKTKQDIENSHIKSKEDVTLDVTNNTHRKLLDYSADLINKNDSGKTLPSFLKNNKLLNNAEIDEAIITTNKKKREFTTINENEETVKIELSQSSQNEIKLKNKKEYRTPHDDQDESSVLGIKKAEKKMFGIEENMRITTTKRYDNSNNSEESKNKNETPISEGKEEESFEEVEYETEEEQEEENESSYESEIVSINSDYSKDEDSNHENNNTKSEIKSNIIKR